MWSCFVGDACWYTRIWEMVPSSSNRKLLQKRPNDVMKLRSWIQLDKQCLDSTAQTSPGPESPMPLSESTFSPWHPTPIFDIQGHGRKSCACLAQTLHPPTLQNQTWQWKIPCKWSGYQWEKHFSWIFHCHVWLPKAVPLETNLETPWKQGS